MNCRAGVLPPERGSRCPYLSYDLQRSLTVFCDFANLFNEPQEMYRYSRDRLSLSTINGTTMTFGVTGRF